MCIGVDDMIFAEEATMGIKHWEYVHSVRVCNNHH